jgi:hypothetical protein
LKSDVKPASAGVCSTGGGPSVGEVGADAQARMVPVATNKAVSVARTGSF